MLLAVHHKSIHKESICTYNTVLQRSRPSTVTIIGSVIEPRTEKRERSQPNENRDRQSAIYSQLHRPLVFYVEFKCNKCRCRQALSRIRGYEGDCLLILGKWVKSLRRNAGRGNALVWLVVVILFYFLLCAVFLCLKGIVARCPQDLETQG